MYSMYYGEKLNAWTHLVGAVVAIPAIVVLIFLAAFGGETRNIELFKK